MPHIDLGNTAPGILGLMAYRPETAKPLAELAEVLLRGPSTLSRGERELIAAHVSGRNECRFCASSHGAVAAAELGEPPETAAVSGKLAALLEIAGRVQRSGSAVTADDVAAARDAGASDAEIHDTVLIAAAFCMYNRYVDGLASVTPDDPATYAEQAELIRTHGYLPLVG